MVENVVVLSKIGASVIDSANYFSSQLNAIPKSSGIICLYGILVDEDGKYCKDDNINLANIESVLNSNQMLSKAIDEKDIKVQMIDLSQYLEEQDFNNKKFSESLQMKIHQRTTLLLALNFFNTSFYQDILERAGIFSFLLKSNDLDGRIKVLKLDHKQTKVLKSIVQHKPKHVLFVGQPGSGKTTFASEVVQKKISALENKKVHSIKLIVIADVFGKESKLLENLRTKHIAFIDQLRNNKKNQPPIQATFATLEELYIKHNIMVTPSSEWPKDLEILSQLTKQEIIKKNGWLLKADYSSNLPPIVEYFQVPNSHEVPVDRILHELNEISGFKGKLTVEWLKAELCQEIFTPKNNQDLVGTLRKVRQNWLLFHFWKEFHKLYPDPSCLSFRLDRLLTKIGNDDPNSTIIVLLDESRLDVGNVNGKIHQKLKPKLKWYPKCPSNIDLVIAVEPSIWEHELPLQSNIESEFQPMSESTMIFYLPVIHRNARTIANLAVANFKTKFSLFLPGFGNQLGMVPKGEKPKWIHTNSLDKDTDILSSLLKKFTKDYNQITWTCTYEPDKLKCQNVCDENWNYVKPEDLIGVESQCLILFGLSQTSNSPRLFFIAKQQLIMIAIKDR